LEDSGVRNLKHFGGCDQGFKEKLWNF